ncbi:CBP80/20-dependent translation initiation factor-like [Physella acuta]|uniref:CBP80/20-dependent translation initiation factor-like n=1 Tax=Physella acuta TaxID=109671 RepID=UPI0027DC63BC|nr:CBP80/20-dependent translation initiation factor-like [Physella acuta]
MSTGRGRARGRSKGINDLEYTSPGGLASRNWAADVDEKESADGDAGSSDGGSHVTAVVNGTAAVQATLSLTDMKSIFDDPRTYSDQNDVKKILTCAKHFVRTEEDVKTLASLIYNKVLDDSSLAKKGSEICDSLTCVEVGAVKFRSCLLALVQSDYKARKELILKDPTRFCCFLAFLCEIFGIMRTATDEVFKPLVKPIFDCFNLLLGRDDTTEDDYDHRGGGDDTIVNDDACEIFSEKLQSIGRLLEENAEEQMLQLIDNIRTCIINSRSSPRVRCSLLEAVEAYARGWESAKNETTRFYCDMAVGIISGLVL